MEFAAKEDMPELLDFLYKVFKADNPAHLRFEELYPELFSATEEAAHRHLIERRGGRIVACVGSYPMSMRICGCRVPVFGVGQVSTARDMRGNGFMTRLMRETASVMTAEGAAVAWLSGRHDRYGRFGWETVLGDTIFYMDAHSARISENTMLVSVSPGHDAQPDAEMEALRQKHCLIEEEPDVHTMRLRKTGCEVLTALEPRKNTPAAWAVLHPESRSMRAFYGETPGIMQIVRSAALRLGSVSIRVCGAAMPALSEKLRLECSGISYSAESLMIVSLRRTIDAYTPLIEKRLNGLKGFTLKMRLEDGSCEQVCICGGGPVVDLDRKRMARLLFDAGRSDILVPGVPSGIHGLSAAFPLPFSLPELFHV